MSCFDRNNIEGIKPCPENYIPIEDDECEQIFKYFVDHKIENYSIFISECAINDNGKVRMLNIGNIEDNTQAFIDNIGKLSDLEQLYFNHSNFMSNLDFEPWKNLEKLSLLYMHNIYDDNIDLNEIPDPIFSITSSKSLSIISHNITKIPSDLSKLVNLEYLDLSNNKIDDQLPEFLNNLENLQEIYFNYNINLKGKNLTNDKLIVCEYDSSAVYDLYQAK